MSSSFTSSIVNIICIALVWILQPLNSSLLPLIYKIRKHSSSNRGLPCFSPCSPRLSVPQVLKFCSMPSQALFMSSLSIQFSKHVVNVIALPGLIFWLVECFYLTSPLSACMSSELLQGFWARLQTQTASHVASKISVQSYQSRERHFNIQWNLGSRTPLFTNNSVQITNTQAGNSGWRQAESIGAGVSVAG
jgi:hypothetical protein